ncbi:hypothetical protein PG988_014829 [Apiospora saccharicola]
MADRIWLVEQTGASSDLERPRDESWKPPHTQNENDLKPYYSRSAAEFHRDIIGRFRCLADGLYGSGNNCFDRERLAGGNSQYSYRAIRERPGTLDETLRRRAYDPTSGIICSAGRRDSPSAAAHLVDAEYRFAQGLFADLRGHERLESQRADAASVVCPSPAEWTESQARLRALSWSSERRISMRRVRGR